MRWDMPFNLGIMYREKTRQIEKVLTDYMEGIHYGDIAKLQNCFDSRVNIFGDIKGEAYIKPINDYIEGVKARKSPSELGELFNMKIIGIEILGKVAVVKLHVPMLGYNYYDFLSLSIIEGQWKIVNKLFTHVA